MSTWDDAKQARAGETVVPVFRKGAFHCHACAVFAPQEWSQLIDGVSTSNIWKCHCTNCHVASYWISFNRAELEPARIYPRQGGAPIPHPDMPDEVRQEYLEAGSVLPISPRGAGALLRLALQKLMPHLGESGENLNDAIASLVKKGLDPNVQKALDALRVIGNNSVHPLELDLRDDAETVGALFGVLNFIVEDRIARPKKLGSLYDSLPEGARQAIEKRDASTQKDLDQPE